VSRPKHGSGDEHSATMNEDLVEFAYY
jgi:hypothetical protein